MMDLDHARAVITAELQDALGGIEADQVASLCDLIAIAGAVFVAGEGRSGLIGRCFAMRLMHLGLSAYVVGETMTPRFGAGDLLIVISASGETATTSAVARLAAEASGKVAAITASEHSILGRSADLVVVVPARASAQYGGSLFEQSSLLALDAVALMLQHRLGVAVEVMDSRHTNLE